MGESRSCTSMLGLTHDPFRDPEEAFFEGGDRTRQLEELRHLGRWSRRLVVVTGEKGLGKSTLFRALSSRLDPGVKAARIKGALLNNARDVLLAVDQGFGLAAPENTNIQMLVNQICNDVAAQSTAQRYCLVLIDDAHLLEARAVEHLLEVVRQQPLRLVFFSEPHFVQILEKEWRVTEEDALEWREIRLAPFGTAEIRRYLKLRLREAGGKGGLPFQARQVTAIIHQSRGNPGRINGLASEHLQTQAQALTHKPASKLPDVHRSIAYLVVVITAFLWLVWQRVQEPVASAAHGKTQRVAVKIPDLPAPTAVKTSAVALVTAPLPEVPVPGTVAWILAQPPSHYTLQLFATSNSDKWQHFIRTQSARKEIASFTFSRKGQGWYVVLYGSYANREAANQAAAELPASMGKLQPWIRTFSGIQRNLEGAR